MTYPEDGGLYEHNLNCYFKLIVEEGKRVKIHFENFDFAPGYNYGIGLASNDNKRITKKSRPEKKGQFVNIVYNSANPLESESRLSPKLVKTMSLGVPVPSLGQLFLKLGYWRPFEALTKKFENTKGLFLNYVRQIGWGGGVEKS